MALTNAEKVRNYRQRQKEKLAELKKQAEPTDEFLKTPFSDFMKDRWGNVTEFLDWLGVDDIPDYEADGDTDPDVWDHEVDRGSIGRAERMVGHFLDGAVTLARYVNDYKVEQLQARMKELEASDLTDLADKKKALAEMVRITKYLDQLKKKVRWEVPQWKVLP